MRAVSIATKLCFEKIEVLSDGLAKLHSHITAQKQPK
jgi:hypothetical protein